MTDRFHSFTVILAKDVREDDAEATMNAIKQLRGVLSVEGNVSGDIGQIVAEMRVRQEIGEALLKIVYPKTKS